MSKGIQTSKSTGLPDVLAKHEADILEQWIREMSVATRRADLIKDSELRGQCTRFVQLLRQGAESDSSNIESAPWQPLREQLAEISKNRAQQGFTPTETATFVLSVKKPLFDLLRDRLSGDANALASELWTTTELIDALALFTTETFLKTREEVIRRQQEEMLELSTPVVKLWEGILALPI
ncbi:MAG: RsbRD N-terminal domain-containing protein, partial [Candidatus Sulfotelmatobacter sp.]